MLLIAQIVLRLVGDVVFDAMAARIRSYESELERYLDERGFNSPRPRPATSK